MKIELITQELYDEILEIQKNVPYLTFQNVGYQYIKKPLPDDAQVANDRINEILKDHILGFKYFNNFCHNKDGDLKLRFQYNYGAENNSSSFSGVGYIKLTELLNGF